MPSDSDFSDGMPSRASLAQEVILFRMQQLSETFYAAGWIEDLEFEVWDMAHKMPPLFANQKVGEEMAKYFRDLARLAGGWWIFPSEEIEEENTMPTFVKMARWKEILANHHS